MARYRSQASIVIGSHHYRSGTTFADTVENALAGDVVYAPFGTSAGITPYLVPLDAGATAIFNASRFANFDRPATIDGVNSTQP